MKYLHFLSGNFTLIHFISLRVNCLHFLLHFCNQAKNMQLYVLHHDRFSKKLNFHGLRIGGCHYVTMFCSLPVSVSQAPDFAQLRTGQLGLEQLPPSHRTCTRVTHVGPQTNKRKTDTGRKYFSQPELGTQQLFSFATTTM